MKKFLILSVCISALFFSCSKNGSSPSGSGAISANISGSTETFNTAAQATTSSVDGAYILSIFGFHGTSGSSDQIAITVDGTSPITVGSYSGSFSGTDQGDIAYIQPSGAKYTLDVNNPVANVVITSITSTNVKGTFTATLSLISGTGAATKTVTSGTFNVNIK